MAMRRKQWAWLAALVLLLELALFHYACLHVIDHSCPVDSVCAVCTYLRTLSRREGALPAAALCVICARWIARTFVQARDFVRCESLIWKKVRLND